MSLTPVTASSSSAGRGGLPAHAHGAGEAVRHGRGVPRVLGAASVAAGLLVPRVRRHEGVGDPTRAQDVRDVRASGVRDGGNDLPRHPHAADAVVPRDLVGGRPEARCQCAGPATCPGTRQLPHRLDVAPQAPPRHGARRPGPPDRRGGSGRNVRGRRRARWGAAPRRQEGPGGGRGGARPGHRSDSPAPGRGLLGGQPAAVRPRGCHPGHRRDHGQYAELPRTPRGRLSP